MPVFEVTTPDGKTLEVNAPAGATQDQVMSYVQQNYKPSVANTIANDEISKGARDFAAQGSDALGGVSQAALNLLAGGVRGAGSIGATAMRLLPNALGGDTAAENTQRRSAMDAALKDFGAQPDSLSYGAGKLGAEVAGTAGLGGLAGRGAAAVLPKLGASEAMAAAISQGLNTGGFRVGGMTDLPGLAVRGATGAAVGGGSAGMVNPEDAGVGATIGGAIPVAAKMAGAAGAGIRNAILGKLAGDVSPEVQQLAQRASDLGIPIPADRLVNSPPLNAVASSLNYIPFSGRAATESAMTANMNRALSRTFGQDSSNVTLALRKADDVLGQKFEQTLKSGVAFDQPLLEGLANVYNKAEAELGPEALKPIAGKIDEIVQKGANGMIDGQAAYNIKRDLDRIGRSNNPNAFHALELKGVLMDALNRSLGPDQAAAFATTRQQYGNMLALQKLAKNGIEGEVSAARLANMPNINNQPLQEMADIAAQFVKGREGQHGAAQRVFGAAGVPLSAFASTIGVPGAGAAALGLAGTSVAGRGVNSLLNSDATKRAVLGLPQLAQQDLGLLTQGAYRTLPLLPASLGQ